MVEAPETTGIQAGGGGAGPAGSQRRRDTGAPSTHPLSLHWLSSCTGASHLPPSPPQSPTVPAISTLLAQTPCHPNRSLAKYFRRLPLRSKSSRPSVQSRLPDPLLAPKLSWVPHFGDNCSVPALAGVRVTWRAWEIPTPRRWAPRPPRDTSSGSAFPQILGSSRWGPRHTSLMADLGSRAQST